MTEKVNPVIEAMARAIWQANNGPWEFAAPEGQEACRHEAKAAAKVLIEEAAKRVPNNWLDAELTHMLGKTITPKDVELALQKTASSIRALAADLGIEG